MDDADRGIQNLAAISWLPGCPKPSLFAVLIAYLDESGTHDPSGKQKGAEVAAIVGYLSTYKRWVKFQRAWRDVLKKYGVKTFHMKFFAHRTGEFKGWPEKKRRAFLSSLIAVIHTFTLFA